ncbi:AraC family transcriptional regulator [Burkholderia sp. LMU1-1-1.1]|uniref:AraC family transcriptional regulator n=1 Tax=Burkholderia sp. LMU1-1-1.1 TaxID=3135266 RepID=UPI003431D21E
MSSGSSGKKPAATLSDELARKCAPFASSTENPTIIPQLTLYRHTAATQPLPVTYTPSIALVVQGSKHVHLGANTFVYDRSRFLLTSIELPVTSQVIEASEAVPYICLRLALDMRLVCEVLASTEPAEADAGGNSFGMETGEATADIVGAFGRLVDALHTPRDASFLGELLQREIIYRVLQSEAGSRLRAIATNGDHSHRTAKAVAWVRANFTKALRVENLAAVAGMGVSTLHYHFRRLTSMSPLQYQKQLRLQEARRRMLVDGLDAASAAFEVGYESASQFNREYSRVFGLSPMRDVRALRDQGGAL